MDEYIDHQTNQHCAPFFTTKLINIVHLFHQEIHYLTCYFTYRVTHEFSYTFKPSY